MHPWKKIIRGKNEELNTKACFMCLEKIPCSDDDIKLKIHLFKVHSSTVHLKELVKICTEVEEREESKGWSLDDFYEEDSDGRKAVARQKKEPGSWMSKEEKGTHETFDNDAEADLCISECFLCDEKQTLKRSNEYSEHLEIQHKVIFGLKKIMNSEEIIQVNDNELENENEGKDPEFIMTDADTVKELVEFYQGRVKSD